MTPPTLRAVLFDAYGTLFDVHSVALMAEQLFASQGQALSQRWRDKQIEYSRLCSMSGQYQPFWELTRAALRHACLSLRLTLTAAGEERLMNEYRHLSAFPENREVLQQLQARGIRAGILSNGDPGMLQVAVQSAGLAPWLDPVLSVHETRRYKTDPAAYALGPAALGLPAREILFVSSNAWDALGATWYGYTTLWVNRQGQPREQLGPPPHHEASSLRGVLALFPDTVS
ncbi:haloacid dehalogenase type II [Pelomonas sp. BJYL3]|uniref:haloacid dehalogenase type II n=1 Tax=Pelomonas sp. BJYL3 TaxID=2976697 RepID=UPI0022B53002|nr:haloacid dehalogenase type II [Pelomonas sp. BJYL3]